MTIPDWIKGIIRGGGGFNMNRQREGGGVSREDVAAWTIRCLANPRCEGSGEIIQAIIDNRCTQLGLPKDMSLEAHLSHVLKDKK